VARSLRGHGVDYDQVRVRPRRGREEVRAISGQSRVPLLVLDGEAICDSRRIVEHLRWRASQGGEPPSAAG
jgi:glutathione S-transferase